MYTSSHNSPESGQHYDPWRELEQGEFGPPAPTPDPEYLEQRELGLEIQSDKNFDTRNFYMALGAVTKAVIAGEPEHLIERIPAQTAFQRRYERRVEKRLDKLVRARLKYQGAHKIVKDKNGEDKVYHTQEFGLRPANNQHKHLKAVRKSYKNGEISKQQMEVEKLKIRATRGVESGVRSFGQRRRRRERFIQSTRAKMVRMPHAGRHAKKNLLPKERKLAEMQGVDIGRRVRVESTDGGGVNRRTKAKQAVKTMAKTAKDDAKALGKYAGRNAKRFAKSTAQGTKNLYNRKRTEARDGYQDGLAGNPNEGKVFPFVDEKIIKPLAHKAGRMTAERRARKQGEQTPSAVRELNQDAEKTVVLVGGVTEGIKTLDGLSQALAEQDLHVVSFDYARGATEPITATTEYHPGYHTTKSDQLGEILHNLEGREDVTLFAHSQGAAIAVEAALAAEPGKVKHLILANPSGLFEDTVPGLVRRFGTETIRKTLTPKKLAVKQQIYGGKEMLSHPKDFLGDAVDIARGDIREAIQLLRSQGVKVDVLLGAKDQVFPWKRISEGINPGGESTPDDIVVDSVSSYFTTKLGRDGEGKQHKFASKWAGHDQPVIYPEQTAKLIEQIINSK